MYVNSSPISTAVTNECSLGHGAGPLFFSPLSEVPRSGAISPTPYVRPFLHHQHPSRHSSHINRLLYLPLRARPLQKSLSSHGRCVNHGCLRVRCPSACNDELGAGYISCTSNWNVGFGLCDSSSEVAVFDVGDLDCCCADSGSSVILA